VEDLRRLGTVPPAEILCQLAEGRYTDFSEEKHIVEIQGHEVFASHLKEHHLPKITINGKECHTHPGKNSVEHLRHLGHVPADEVLSQISDGKPVDLKDDAYVEIHGGEVFVSHKREHHKVEIKINNVAYKTHPGENSVAHLRELGHVPVDEILAQFKDGQFIDLANNVCVEIHGGEIFASHKPSGGSS
jgi:hypothetical protein